MRIGPAWHGVIVACAVAIIGALVLAGCGSTPTRRSSVGTLPPSAPSAGPSGAPSTRGGSSAGGTLPRPAHVVVAVMENRAYGEIIGNSSAPYLNQLAASGAVFTQYFAIRHPSQPNYVALFSGSTQGLTSDSCPHSFTGPNLATQLRAAGDSFTGYSESLPSVGYSGCNAGTYARRHAPWTDFPALPAQVNQPFTAFPSDYSRLPTLAFVIPDLQHDMHDGTIAQGDQWLREHLSGYAQWARTHDSLLVITWDEDDKSANNRIPTIIVGAHVRAGHYGERVTHYRMLRTLEALERLPAIGKARATTPVTDIWTQ